VRKLLLLMVAFLPLALAVACGSDDNKSSSSSSGASSSSSGTTSPGDALSTAAANAATVVGTRAASAGTAVSQGASTVQAGASTAVTGAATQVSAGAGTLQAGASTAVTGAATQTTAGAATVTTGVATARAGNATAIALPITDADSARDALLNAAKSGDWSKTGSPTDLSQYPAWQNIANAMKLAGAAVAADPGTVSVYRDTLNAGTPPSTANPNVIAFTVDDQNGKCSAGVIKGYPNYDTYQTVQLQGKPCTAQSVVDQVKSTT
jgi:hypothetical protein